jgi:transcriptional regulator with XRE-family HTH domain
LNIKERREQLGISQKELADRAGISQSFLCDIEQGRCKPSIDTAVRLAKELDIKDIKFFETE